MLCILLCTLCEQYYIGRHTADCDQSEKFRDLTQRSQYFCTVHAARTILPILLLSAFAVSFRTRSNQIFHHCVTPRQTHHDECIDHQLRPLPAPRQRFVRGNGAEQRRGPDERRTSARVRRVTGQGFRGKRRVRRARRRGQTEPEAAGTRLSRWQSVETETGSAVASAARCRCREPEARHRQDMQPPPSPVSASLVLTTGCHNTYYYVTHNNM